MRLGFKVTTNGFPTAPAAMRKAIGAGFAASRPEALSELQRRTPVDTGELRSSESVESDENALTMRATAGHSLVVHQGSRFMQGRPFMRDAIEAVVPKVVENIAKAAEMELK